VRAGASLHGASRFTLRSTEFAYFHLDLTLVFENEVNVMKTDIATLNELIDVLEDGKKFYVEAATRVTRPDLSALFSRMARTKGAIENDLRAAVVARGDKPSKDGSFAGSMLKGYAELRAKLSSDKNYAYVAELEHFEDRILKAFKQAAQKADNPGVRAIAERYMADVQRDHAQMRDLKHHDHAA
jgi:uncharacterized protein (TIGR02284 family)